MTWEDFTPTERRIVEVLKDCQPHSKNALYDCLEDELSGPTALSYHLTNIRHKLRILGYTVAPCFPNGSHVHYQIVSLADPSKLHSSLVH